MTQRDGRETYFTAVSNHVAPALWSGMADGNLITREEPRNYRRSTRLRNQKPAKRRLPRPLCQRNLSPGLMMV